MRALELRRLGCPKFSVVVYCPVALSNADKIAVASLIFSLLDSKVHFTIICCTQKLVCFGMYILCSVFENILNPEVRL